MFVMGCAVSGCGRRRGERDEVCGLRETPQVPWHMGVSAGEKLSCARGRRWRAVL